MDHRPVVPALANGIRECVHCATLCNSYCKSCRRAVCVGSCFDQHELDHSEWWERRVGWTEVAR